MGCFTTIIDTRDNKDYQIKCGYDICEIYKLGDKVDQHMIDIYPGEGYLLDDVYEGCNYPNQDAWVIIKDGYVHDIIPLVKCTCEEDDCICEGIESEYSLRQKYNIKNGPARELWSEQAWKEKEERELEWKIKAEKERKEYDKFVKEHPDASPLALSMMYPIYRQLAYKGIARAIFNIEPLKEDNK